MSTEWQFLVDRHDRVSSRAALEFWVVVAVAMVCCLEHLIPDCSSR